MSLVAITPPDVGPLWANFKSQAFTDAINQMLPIIRADFEETVATWKTQPKFIIKNAAVIGGDLVGGVSTNDEIYGYVNYGTQPHMIVPVQAKALRWLSVYAPKTRPGVIGSFPGGASGDPVFAKAVMHPGSQGRHFDQKIIEIRQPQIEALMIRLLNRK